MSGLTPSELPRLSGSEVFRESRRSVLEFWQWAMGDLRMNTARGVLAEYLIAVAVDSTTPFRIEWAGHDVTGADGTRIEAKSAAYLQSWAQKRPSTPRFDWKAANAKIWDPQVGAEVDPPNGRADVWVFALQTCGDHALYDPLDEGQWTFWVAPHWRVARCAQVSGGLVYMRKMAGEPVVWGNLAHAVALARRQNDDLA
jgi:hypothetical protein